MNNTQINNPKDIDIVMPMYNSVEYSDNYSKISGSLWHYNRDETFFDNGAFSDFPANNKTVPRLNLKQKKQAEKEMMVQKMLKIEYH